MKLTTLLPILAADAQKHRKKKENRSVERFIASEVTNQCSDQVPSLGGGFESINSGLSGEISLTDYPNHTNCKQVVQADSSCEQIRIQYRNVAVEDSHICELDSFRFGWTDNNGFQVTPARCSCFGDGCDGQFLESYSYFYYTTERYDLEYDQSLLGPNTFVLNSNSFTFYFTADYNTEKGHVIFDWECVEAASTTPTIAASTK